MTTLLYQYDRHKPFCLTTVCDNTVKAPRA